MSHLQLFCIQLQPSVSIYIFQTVPSRLEGSATIEWKNRNHSENLTCSREHTDTRGHNDTHVRCMVQSSVFRASQAWPRMCTPHEAIAARCCCCCRATQHGSPPHARAHVRLRHRLDCDSGIRITAVVSKSSAHIDLVHRERELPPFSNHVGASPAMSYFITVAFIAINSFFLWLVCIVSFFSWFLNE